ncbi:hypothetical protein SAMN04488587_1280 [Methanococcoides vulcani]|uniref:AbiJ N-terminal domain-containing protein n=1 Tax=Methanococcoides vulcani TaxID=1353158 RepID=A0A1H9ZUI0_9EURY|nr:hypothetical protein [Methanococcoides vulcani]SES85365.1 hypothetical protein SAMN04488587_1280 [Methanococcoides vulcani]
MIELNKKQKNSMGIMRFSRFVERYLYDTDWNLIATCCGVSEILNKYERVTRAQTFGDPDYPTAISRFLIDVFEYNEAVGLLLINEIVSQDTLNDEAKIELNEILTFFSNGDVCVSDYTLSFNVSEPEKFITLTNYPDDFYKKLIDEINFQYSSKHPMSLSILIRKLFENLIIDILRKKYGTQEMEEYYNIVKRRFHDFSLLLKNLDLNKSDFHYISSNLNKELIAELNKYREYGNSGAHSIDVDLRIENFANDKTDINHKVIFLVRILNNI